MASAQAPKVPGSGSRVWGFRVWVLGCRVQSFFLLEGLRSWVSGPGAPSNLILPYKNRRPLQRDLVLGHGVAVNVGNVT